MQNSLAWILKHTSENNVINTDVLSGHHDMIMKCPALMIQDVELASLQENSNRLIAKQQPGKQSNR